jgi:hypothetical protein
MSVLIDALRSVALSADQRRRQSCGIRDFLETLGYATHMPSMARREEILRDIMRLRRVEQSAPRLRDVATVRSHLEQELGRSVPRSVAARFLGVSHTALQKWIDAGDLPLVLTPAGKKELPIAPVMELHDAISSERDSGQRRLHVIEPAMKEARLRAAALEPKTLVDGNGSSEPHERAERRNRAYHAAVARTLRRRTVNKALHQLWRWEEEGNIDPRYAAEWEEILRRPLPEIKAILTDDSQHSRDLRQNSPFAGALSEPERRRILEEIR